MNKTFSNKQIIISILFMILLIGLFSYFGVTSSSQQTSLTETTTVNSTNTPTRLPSKKPTAVMTKSPTRRPIFPTLKPITRRPSVSPTKLPTKNPTKNPTKKPTRNPTNKPTTNPTKNPITIKPTTLNPTTKKPTTQNPSNNPSNKPTKNPTKNPTVKPLMAGETYKIIIYPAVNMPTVNPSVSYESSPLVVANQNTINTVIASNPCHYAALPRTNTGRARFAQNIGIESHNSPRLLHSTSDLTYFLNKQIYFCEQGHSMCTIVANTLSDFCENKYYRSWSKLTDFYMTAWSHDAQDDINYYIQMRSYLLGMSGKDCSTIQSCSTLNTANNIIQSTDCNNNNYNMLCITEIGARDNSLYDVIPSNSKIVLYPRTIYTVNTNFDYYSQNIYSIFGNSIQSSKINDRDDNNPNVTVCGLKPHFINADKSDDFRPRLFIEPTIWGTITCK